MEAKYAKGEKPRDLDAAKGGLVLDRVRSFIKDPDDFHPLGTGMNGPENCQSYAKGGANTADNDGDEPKRKGDTKSLSMKGLTPRK